MGHFNQIFIGGTGRSGTTITGKLLGLHPNIHYPSLKFVNKTINPELRLIIDPDGCIDLINNLSIYWSYQRADIAVKRFLKLTEKVMKRSFYSINRHLGQFIYGKIFPKLNFSGPKYGYHYYGDIIPKNKVLNILNKFINEISEGYFKGQWVGSNFSLNSKIFKIKRFEKKKISLLTGKFINNLYSEILSEKEIYWCDSTPFNILFASELLDMFPRSKIIHIYRDPRDVISSYLTKSWGGNNIDDSILIIKETWKKWDQIKKTFDKTKYIEIKLEDFINNFSKNFRKLLVFLNLENIENIEKYNILNSRSVGRYKKDLTEFQINKLNHEFKSILLQYNYD